MKIINILSLLLIINFTGCASQKESINETVRRPNIQIILGSTREGRSSDKIGSALKKMSDKRTDLSTEIVDLKNYNLGFFSDKTPPAQRKEKITDPKLKKWSDKIQKADGFIIVVPEYNSGYPGVLKNALDSLYKEWNNKPVAIVSYSGGPSGGISVTAQLRQVLKALEMNPVEESIKIPSSWKAFDNDGNLNDKNIEKELNVILDKLIK